MISYPLKNDDFRLLAFCLALLLYGFAGSPTPDSPGLTEILIAGLLVFAVGSGSIEMLLRPLSVYRIANRIDANASFFSFPLWYDAGRILLLYGSTAGLFTFLLYGHPPAEALRDFIAFLFLLCPVFLAGLFDKNPHYSVIAYVMAGLIGVLFSLRAYAQIYSDVLNLFSYGFIISDELTYFSNAPTVFFTFFFLIGYFIQSFVRSKNFKEYLSSFLILGILLVFSAPMVINAQRAPLAFAGLLGAGFMLFHFVKSPYRSLPLLISAALVPVFAYAYIFPVFDMILQKTQQVGLNMRVQEWQAVLDSAGSSWLSLLFGQGWGAGFYSPATGYEYVIFTHNIFSAFLLKTGLCGVGILLLYLRGIFDVLIRNFKAQPIIITALLSTLVICTLLYASFKSLDFGIILLLCVSTLPLRVENK